jgi:hypothetical protein
MKVRLLLLIDDAPPHQLATWDAENQEKAREIAKEVIGWAVFGDLPLTKGIPKDKLALVIDPEEA